MSDTAWIDHCVELNAFFSDHGEEELAGVFVRIAQYADAVNGLVAEIEARREVAQGWLEDLEDALDELRQAADGARPRVEAGVTAIRDAVSVLTGGLVRVRDSIRETAQTAIGALDQVRATLVSSVTAVASARDDSARHLADSATSVRDLETRLVEEGARARGVVSGLEAALTEASGVAHDLGHEVAERMDLIARNAPPHSKEAAADAAALALQVRATTGPSIDALAEGVASLLFDLGDDTLKEAEAMGPAIRALGTAQERLGPLVDGIADRLAGGREELASGLATLAVARALTARQVGYSREAAVAIGVDWENPQ